MGVVYQKQAGVWVELPGYVSTPSGTMSAQEFYRWQIKAALLDPLAYTTLVGSGATATVPTGETWYVLSAWQIDTGTPTHFHRVPNAADEDYFVLREGETITHEPNAGAISYICKPKTVIDADARYTADPKGLFFERLYRADTELTHYDLGLDNTGASTSTTPFPTDFTYGMVVACSSHDVAWTTLEHSSTTTGINLNNEVSDTDRIRFAQRVLVPFDRTTYPKVKNRGVSQSEGTSNVRYVKLPSDW